MKKNKGFTLVELLAVLVILSILVAFSTIAIGNIKKKQDEKNRENVISYILTGAKKYVAENPTTISINVENLVLEKYVDFDTTKYSDIYSDGLVGFPQCYIGSIQRKTVFFMDGVAKYNDCGCLSQSTGISDTLCEGY